MSSVEDTMHFDKQSCSSSRDSFSSAIDGSCASFTVSPTVSGVSVIVWVQDTALDAVSKVVVARFVVVASSDMGTE